MAETLWQGESSNGFKFEYTHTLEADTYLEERKEELTKILDDSDKILLKAPTGAGKSTFISNYCIERLKQAFEESADCDSEGGGHVIIFQPNSPPTSSTYYPTKSLPSTLSSSSPSSLPSLSFTKKSNRNAKQYC